MRRKLYLLLVVALLAAACGDDDEAKSSDTADTADTGKPAADGEVTSLEGVESAVIQIVAKGTFAQPDGSLAAFAEVEGAGSGSGFIIDPAGIAVTNNHVVTGAATLEVFVAGEDEPVNAKVLGVSECSDLAVIDLDGDGYPYLSWYGGDIAPGLEVRAAGFPLGDPEYTLTSGIVSKAEADGDTDWASVDSVIEQDANIQPGNSGGPLVTADTGQVVAVNYAGGDVGGTGTSQFFSIGADLAEPTVAELEGGDVESLGVNGVAVYDEESGIQGIWVSSVDTDSPAGGLGLEGGDIIERLEGITVGADGTMKDYCDIVRSHELTDKLAVQVLRFEENARLEGEFNGDELVPVESLVEEVVEQGGIAEEGTAYTDYVQVEDDSGTVSVQVPAEWDQVDGSPRESDSGPVPSVAAAPDLGAYFESWLAPGVEVMAVGSDAGVDVGAALDDVGAGAAEACTDAGREPYEDQLYSGQIQYYSDCGGTGSAVVLIAAQPPDAQFTALVIVQLATEADAAVLDQVIQTFVVKV